MPARGETAVRRERCRRDLACSPERVLPASPRRDSAIDPALDAVCLKAMSLKPEDRYDSCRSLADDVERWAADEPVSAWREPLPARAGRWLRRHRTWVIAASSAAVVMLLGLSAVATVQARAYRDLMRYNTDLLVANRRESAARSQAERGSRWPATPSRPTTPGPARTCS